MTAANIRSKPKHNDRFRILQSFLRSHQNVRYINCFTLCSWADPHQTVSRCNQCQCLSDISQSYCVREKQCHFDRGDGCQVKRSPADDRNLGTSKQVWLSVCACVCVSIHLSVCACVCVYIYIYLFQLYILYLNSFQSHSVIFQFTFFVLILMIFINSMYLLIII